MRHVQERGKGRARNCNALLCEVVTVRPDESARRLFMAAAVLPCARRTPSEFVGAYMHGACAVTASHDLRTRPSQCAGGSPTASVAATGVVSGTGGPAAGAAKNVSIDLEPAAAVSFATRLAPEELLEEPLVTSMSIGKSSRRNYRGGRGGVGGGGEARKGRARDMDRGGRRRGAKGAGTRGA